MSGRRWLRAVSDHQWALVATDINSPAVADPTASFTSQVQTNTVQFDASKSFSTNGPITGYRWDFGDGSTGGGIAVAHVYATGASYPVRLDVTDLIGRTSSSSSTVTVAVVGPRVPPTARLTGTVSGLTVAFDASASTDSDGSIVSYRFSFGDGTMPVVSTTANLSHLYAASGPYTATLTVTDNTGLTGSVSLTVSPAATTPTPTPAPGGTGAIYTAGSMYQSIPSTVRVYTLADLGLSTSTTNLQTIVDRLPGPGIIQLPGNGWTGHIPNFAHHSSSTNSAGSGIINSNLRGLLGVISAGTMQTKIQVDAGALSASQIAYQASNTSGTTELYAIRAQEGFSHYYAGLIFDGADLGTFTSKQTNRTGPVTWGGLDFYRTGPGTVFQNNLMRGFGRADTTSPPGEVGNWGEAHSTGYLFRRVEHDGRLPLGAPGRGNSSTGDPYGMGWRRGGGLQWNNATGFLMEDVHSHDTWDSGVTMSFTSLPASDSNNTHDYVTRRLNVQGNGGWGGAPGNQNSTFFPLVNMEFNYGKVQHYQPRFGGIANWGGWNNCHHRLWGVGTFNVNGVATTYTANASFALEVYQPTFDAGGTNPAHNGCYSMYYSTSGKYTSFDGKTIGGRWVAPKVYYSTDLSKPAIPYVLRGGTALPSNVTRANNYYVLCIS